MKEEILQNKIVEIIKSKSLLEFITNQERLNEALNKDSDENMIPNFSIDHLLKEKYSASAKRVLQNLDDYDIISGESIRSISLDRTQRLYPDLILFNRLKRQIVVIENKTSGQTERESITELFGYAHEIRNHLPFFSDYDINYILIATDFNTLLDHSLAGQLLISDINLLCLKPEIIDEYIKGLSIYFPSGWSDIGQLDLTSDALVSYTMCLYEKENISMESFDVTTVVKMACDLIRNSAGKFKSSGLYLVWQNGHGDYLNHCKIGITIYVINPFAFLPPAYSLGFPLNTDSVLAKYLKLYVEDNGTLIHPSSMFGIAEEAERLLDKYFIVEWDRASSWQIDMADKHFALQRRPLQWDSWGAIGDYVRYCFLHPASSRYMFTDWEREKGGGYFSPYIGLQIINQLAGDKIFKLGAFSHREIFQFGLQLGCYRYACKNANELDEDKAPSYEAFLFWNALQITQSIKEITARVRDTPDINAEVSFPLAIEKAAIYPDYNRRIDNFVNWFTSDFINAEQNPTMARIFELAIQTFHYFDPLFESSLPSQEKLSIEATYSSIVREKVAEISLDKRSSVEYNYDMIASLNKNYYSGNLLELSDKEIIDTLSKIPDNELTKEFDCIFLSLLDSIKGGLFHNLNPLQLSNAIDWKAFKESADHMYDEGNRKLSILISQNGIVGLGIIESIMSLNNKDEIFVQFYPTHSVQLMTLRVKWEDLQNGNFKL
ncbi:MAG: hypothetical protein EOO43_01435 [Flavobacterium sp.]|nr:MAG: hypothetical protein EOO43_01435 [Flavobacterium sp.]